MQATALETGGRVRGEEVLSGLAARSEEKIGRLGQERQLFANNFNGNFRTISRSEGNERMRGV